MRGDLRGFAGAHGVVAVDGQDGNVRVEGRHFGDDTGVTSVVNVEVADGDDEAQAVIDCAEARRVGGNAFDAGAPDADALPRAQDGTVFDVGGGALAGDDLCVRSAQLFNVRQRAVFVVFVADEDDISRTGDAG